MMTNKCITAAMSAVAVVGFAGVASANNTIASTVETTGTTTDFTYSAATQVLTMGGALPVQATDVDGNVVPGTFYVTSLAEDAGTATTSALGTGALFGGGTFDISTSGTSGNLLSGTFAASELVSSNGSTGDILNTVLDNVTYTGGSFLTEFNSKYGGNGALGDLTIDLSAINPVLSITNGNLNSFTAEGSSTTFDAQATPAAPEPGTIAPFAFGAIGLLGLIGRARRTSRLSA